MEKVDLKIGSVFGQLTVIAVNMPSYKGHTRVKCRCSCGNEFIAYSTKLNTGKTTRCKRCSLRDRNVHIEIGSTYKHWTVIEGPVYINHTCYYKVQCTCGKTMYKIPLYIVDPHSNFSCKDCSRKDIGYNATIKNGRVGDFTKTLYTKFKRSAESRNLEFAVTMKYLVEVFNRQNNKCAITGDPIPELEKASIDRIDSSKGYVEGNVQFVTTQANLSKHIMSMSELYEFCKKVLNHANQQPSQGLTSLEGSETNG